MIPLNTQPAERQDLVHTGSKLDVVEVWHTVQGEGPFAGTPAVFVRLAGCNLQCPYCFHGNTVIRMADGSTKLISEVRTGDKVLSYDETSGLFVKKKVKSVMTREVRSLYRLRTESNKKTYVTGEHPFLVKGKGWTKAADLKLGDKILHLGRSELKRLFNPMKDPETVAKMMATTAANGGNPGPWHRMTEDEQQEFRDKASDRMTNDNPMKNPETAIKGFLARKDRGKMTGTEKLVLRLGKRYGVRFVGDGDLVVGHKVPDFIVEGTNKLIETWSASQTEYLGRDQNWQDTRRKMFEDAGYKVLFLPVADGIGKKKQKALAKTLAEYARNGETVKELTLLSAKKNPKAWTRLAGTLVANVTVYNLEVQDTHTYVADGMVVHNCDTDYTTDRVVRSVDEVVEMVENAKGSSWTGLVVLTGGEPFRQAIGPLALELLGRKWQVQVETNGTLYQDDFPFIPTTVVCSPKTPKINPQLEERVAAYKYVLEAGKVHVQDGLPITTLGRLGDGYMVHRPAKSFPRDQVFVQPLDVQDPEKNAANLRATVESAMTFGYRACLQTHKLMGVP